MFKPGGQRHTGRAFQHIAQQPGAAGRVGPLLACRVFTRQRRHNFTYAIIGAGLRFTLGQAGKVRLRIGVIFIPVHAAGMLNELPERHAVPGGAFQFGFVNGDQVIEGVDFPLLNGDADQRRNHRFPHRARGPQRGIGVAVAKVFPGDFAIFQHQHAADVLALQVIL